MTPDHVRRLTGALLRRITGTVSRGVVRADDDSGGRQTLQVELAGREIRSKVERFQQFGLTSRAPVDGTTEALVLSVGGDRAHMVALAVESRAARPRNVAAGETMLHSAGGNVITVYLRADGSLAIVAPTQVTVTSPLVTLVASTKVHVDSPRLECTGEIIDHCADGAGRTLKSLRDAYNVHIHTAPNGATSAPSVLD